MRTFNASPKDKLIQDIEAHMAKLVKEFDQKHWAKQPSLADYNTDEKLNSLFSVEINELQKKLQDKSWAVFTVYAGVSSADEIATQRERIVTLTKYAFLKALESKIKLGEAILTADEMEFIGKDILEEEKPVGDDTKPIDIAFQATFKSKTKELYEKAKLIKPNAVVEMSTTKTNSPTLYQQQPVSHVGLAASNPITRL